MLPAVQRGHIEGKGRESLLEIGLERAGGIALIDRLVPALDVGKSSIFLLSHQLFRCFFRLPLRNKLTCILFIAIIKSRGGNRVGSDNHDDSSHGEGVHA